MKPIPLPEGIQLTCRRVISDLGLDEYFEPMLKATAPQIRCESRSNRQGKAKPALAGCTKLGGFPDLPAATEWPKYNGKYLPFIAQINLAQLPAFDGSPLPSSGRLYYFYWCTNEVAEDPSSVLYLPDGPVSCREVPVDQVCVDWTGESLYEEDIATRFALGADLSDRIVAAELGIETYELEHVLSCDQQDEFVDEVTIRLEHELDVWEAIPDSDRDESSDDEIGGHVGKSRIIIDEYTSLIDLLGYAELDYNLPEFQPVPGGGYANDGELWYIIGEIGSCNNMMWSDVGYIAFLICERDLRRRDFSRVQVQLISSERVSQAALRKKVGTQRAGTRSHQRTVEEVLVALSRHN